LVDLGLIGFWSATLTDNANSASTISVSGLQFGNLLIGFGGLPNGSGGDDDGEDDNSDDTSDDDADDMPPVASEQLIIDALDALMFADDPTFALDTAALTSWRNRLRIAAV